MHPNLHSTAAATATIIAAASSTAVAIPYLIVANAAKAINFYTSAFNAIELVRLADGDGKVMHAEIRIGAATFMLADEFPDMGYRSPQSYGGSSVSILLYVEDVDAVFAKAVSFGGVATVAVADQFDGDRRGTLTDPFGHIWLLASKKETITYDELQRRFAAMMAQVS